MALLQSGGLQFETDERILFLASPESLLPRPPQQEDKNFTACVFIRAIEETFAEENETVSVMIDDMSLMPNDEAGEPSQLEITIIGNNFN